MRNAGCEWKSLLVEAACIAGEEKYERIWFVVSAVQKAVVVNWPPLTGCVESTLSDSPYWVV